MTREKEVAPAGCPTRVIITDFVVKFLQLRHITPYLLGLSLYSLVFIDNPIIFRSLLAFVAGKEI
jgi:hypothetical protein